MMPQSKPAIIGTAVAVWLDAFRVIVAMPLVAGVAFVILFLFSFTLWISRIWRRQSAALLGVALAACGSDAVRVCGGGFAHLSGQS